MAQREIAEGSRVIVNSEVLGIDEDQPDGATSYKGEVLGPSKKPNGSWMVRFQDGLMDNVVKIIAAKDMQLMQPEVNHENTEEYQQGVLVASKDCTLPQKRSSDHKEGNLETDDAERKRRRQMIAGNGSQPANVEDHLSSSEDPKEDRLAHASSVTSSSTLEQGSPRHNSNYGVFASFPSAFRAENTTWTLRENIEDTRGGYELNQTPCIKFDHKDEGGFDLYHAHTDGNRDESDKATADRPPFEYFKSLLWSSETLEKIVDYTNVRLACANITLLDGAPELFRFLGVLIRCARFPNHSLENLWRVSEGNGCTPVEHVMTLDRFQQILDNLSFTGSDVEEWPRVASFGHLPDVFHERSYLGCPSIDFLIKEFNAQRKNHIVPGHGICVSRYEDHEDAGKKAKCYCRRQLAQNSFGKAVGTPNPPLNLEVSACCSTGIILRLEVSHAHPLSVMDSSQDPAFAQAVRLVSPWFKNRTLYTSGVYSSLDNAVRFWRIYNMSVMFKLPIASHDSLRVSLETLPFQKAGESVFYQGLLDGEEGLQTCNLYGTAWNSGDGVWSVLSTCGSSEEGKPHIHSHWSTDGIFSQTEIPRDTITAEVADSIFSVEEHRRLRGNSLALEQVCTGEQWQIQIFCKLLGITVVDSYLAREAFDCKNTFKKKLPSLVEFQAYIEEELLNNGRVLPTSPVNRSDGHFTSIGPTSVSSTSLSSARGKSEFTMDSFHKSIAGVSPVAHEIQGMTRFNREVKIWNQVNPKLRCSECARRGRIPALQTCNFCLTCSIAKKGNSPEWTSDHVVRLCKQCIPLHYVDGGEFTNAKRKKKNSDALILPMSLHDSTPPSAVSADASSD